MGYYSNGTEGMMYEEQYCDKCLHNQNEEFCAVWSAHIMFNYDYCNVPDDKNPLNVLIPRSKDKLSNEKCRMFITKGKL